MNATIPAISGGLTRRRVLFSLAALPLLGACSRFAATSGRNAFADRLARLETESGGRLGVAQVAWEKAMGRLR